MSTEHQIRFAASTMDGKAEAYREVYRDIIRNIDAGLYVDDESPKEVSEFNDQLFRCLAVTISQLPSIYVLSFRINQDVETERFWVEFINLSEGVNATPTTVLEVTSLQKPESNVVALNPTQLPPLLEFFQSFLSEHSELPVAVPSVALDLYEHLTSVPGASVSGDPLKGPVRQFHLETDHVEASVSIYTDNILKILDDLSTLPN